MSEEVTTASVAEPETVPEVKPETPQAKPTGKKKRKRRHPVRTTIIILAVLAALGVGIFFLVKFLGTSKEADSQMMTQTADFGSIQSTVQGSGSARSKESAAITLENAGIVQSVFVTEGQVVNEGDPPLRDRLPCRPGGADRRPGQTSGLPGQPGQGPEGPGGGPGDLS